MNGLNSVASSPKQQNICILGATGSIGESTLKVLTLHPDRYRVHSLSGFTRLEKLAELTLCFKPQRVAVATGQTDVFLEQLRLQSERLQSLTTNYAIVKIPDIVEGEAGLVSIATDSAVQIVMAAIVGAAGLVPTLAAVKAGKRILLANKEALVMAGDIFMQAVYESGAQLLPVDSEHNAIFQCLPADYFAFNQHSHQSLNRDTISKNAPISTPGTRAAQHGIKKILLTASGGPFRSWSAEQIAKATPAQACKHPNWSMGQKISVDSASLMNKGLELIEACHLFALPESSIEVVVHPQSIIHSMVQYVDGSTLAQLGVPDMATPIASALAWPERMAAGVADLDIVTIAQLQFEAPDLGRFPCLRLARQAMQQGGTAPAILNAANEVVVAAFLAERVDFGQIAPIIEHVMNRISGQTSTCLETILSDDALARQMTHQIMGI